MTVTLVRHDIKYAEAMHALSSMPQVRDALGLPAGKVEDTIHFIKRERIDEEEGKTVPRVILDEEGQVIGVTSLMFIDRHKRAVISALGLAINFGERAIILKQKGYLRYCFLN